MFRHWTVNTSSRGHSGQWTHRVVDTAYGRGHSGPWTQRVMDTSGRGHSLWSWTYRVLVTAVWTQPRKSYEEDTNVTNS